MRKRFVLILFSAIILSLFLFNQEVKSDSDSNVSGWAWADTIGWISFNCTDREADTGKTCLDFDDSIFNPVANLVDYGVNIDGDGLFSGHAWSDNVGWISFNQSDLIGCPWSPCRAELKIDTGEVSGWARALSYNDDSYGFIGFDHGQEAGEVYIDSDGDFHGLAWSDNIGWISFNCNNPETGDVCSTSDYKVETSFSFNSPPKVEELELEEDNYCNTSWTAWFSWTYEDDEDENQSAYWIQIREKDNSWDSLVDEKHCITSEECSGNSKSYSPVLGILENNKTYYWRVMVWDQEDESSDWEGCTSGDCVLDTPNHDYPMVDFDWEPINPAAEEVVQFYDKTDFDDSYGTWDWDFGDESPGSDQPNPTHSYDGSENYNVRLEACDDYLYCCAEIKILGTSFPLPEWEETHP